MLDPAHYPLFADSRAVGGVAAPVRLAVRSARTATGSCRRARTTPAYKRLLKPFSIPAGGGTVKLFTSYDLEPDYDYQFVEIHTVGDDDWTTLQTPTATRATTSARPA